MTAYSQATGVSPARYACKFLTINCCRCAKYLPMPQRQAPVSLAKEAFNENDDTLLFSSRRHAAVGECLGPSDRRGNGTGRSNNYRRPLDVDPRASEQCHTHAGYCTNGMPAANPGTNLMQPYYFPHIEGRGQHLQGFFDYRPRNADEAVAAANSFDAGKTWRFQQLAAQLSAACPTNPNDPDNSTSPGGVFDNGQGHPFLLDIDHHRLLYTLDRSDGNIDVLGLIVHDVSPTPRHPLRDVPLNEPVPIHNCLGRQGC